jgi:hypothetical protein
MSTILKALRRLEQEKSTRSDRPLGEAVAGGAPAPAPPATTSRRWPVFAGLAIGVIVLGAAAFAALQWRGGGEAPEPVEIAAVPVTPEAPAAKAPARKSSAPARAQANTPNQKRLSRQARNRGAEPSAPIELPRQASASDVARHGPPPTSRAGASQTPAASARPVVTQQPGAAPASSGEPVMIDLSQLEALQAAARAGSGASAPETIAAAPVVATPAETSPPPAEVAKPSPPPEPESKAAPVEVAVARPAPKPAPTLAPSVAKKSAPPPKAAPEPQPKVEPKPEPKAEPEPEPKAPRSFARKSPPRPSSRPSPKVYVSRTVWHPDASRRLAYVELEGRDGAVPVREGESIGPLVVTEIAPTGVSFDDRGSELTRRVGAR